MSRDFITEITPKNPSRAFQNRPKIAKKWMENHKKSTTLPKFLTFFSQKRRTTKNAEKKRKKTKKGSPRGGGRRLNPCPILSFFERSPSQPPPRGHDGHDPQLQSRWKRAFRHPRPHLTSFERSPSQPPPREPRAHGLQLQSRWKRAFRHP